MKPLRGLIVLLAGILVSVNAGAQSRQQRKTDSVFRLIKSYIPTRDANAIYDLAGDRFKTAISQGVFRDFLFRDLFKHGPILKDSLLSFVNNVTADYKLQMDDAAFQLTLSLDNADKFNYFKLQPYKETARNKSAPVASDNPLTSPTDKIVDSVVRRYIQRSNTVGISIGVIKNGSISTYNYGETTKDSKQLPAPNTVYEIGSISKTFTGTLLAWFVNEGKLKLTDPVIKYMPDSVASNPALKSITLAELSNHTSGLPSIPSNFSAQKDYQESNPYRYYNRDLLFAYLKTCSLRSEPGKKYAYSNLAVGLLGTILERISGKSYEQLVAEIICKPLSLKSTVQHITPAIAQHFAPVYDENGVRTSAWDFDALAACGSLKSTITDLLAYTKANMIADNTKLSKAFEVAHQITFNAEPAIALGWHIIRVNDVSYYFHNGGTGGSSSFLAYNADKGLGIVILSNADVSTDATGVGILTKLQ